VLIVADFTYEPTCGFGYTAFVVDAYAGVIAGWECSLRKDSQTRSAPLMCARTGDRHSRPVERKPGARSKLGSPMMPSAGMAWSE